MEFGVSSDKISPGTVLCCLGGKGVTDKVKLLLYSLQCFQSWIVCVCVCWNFSDVLSDFDKGTDLLFMGDCHISVLWKDYSGKLLF